jgi:hypothetical protein
MIAWIVAFVGFASAQDGAGGKVIHLICDGQVVEAEVPRPAVLVVATREEPDAPVAEPVAPALLPRIVEATRRTPF